ncbi:ABC transporter substrate-binding protein [Clostridia bacterium]|nr:ABC transporter substrate-binding protein [Clostridia bacterium]
MSRKAAIFRGTWKYTVYIATVLVLSAAFFLSSFVYAQNEPEISARSYLSDDRAIVKAWNAYDSADVRVNVYWDTPALLTAGETFTIPVDIPSGGEYIFLLEYAPAEQNIFENTARITVGEQSRVCALPFLWADDKSALRKDRYGNEIVPDQYQISVGSSAFLEDYELFSREPIRFYLNAGIHALTITPQNQSFLLYGVTALIPAEDVSYNIYRAAFNGAADFDGVITIEGEAYRAKSDSYIRGRNVPNMGVVPNDPIYKLVNAIDDKSNKSIGQKILYEADVPIDGIYYLSVKYSQPLKAGGMSYRTVEIDGAVPFDEARNVGFTHTGIDKYENFTLGGDTPFDIGIYLTKGIHTIAFKTTSAPLDSVYAELKAVISEINDASIRLKKLKGSNSDDTAKIDVNRTWDILQYMPDILTLIDDWSVRVEAAYNALAELSGGKPSFASDLMLAAQNLKRLASEPREIPNRMSLLSDDEGSAAQLASLVLTQLQEQNLSIDRIYLHGQSAKLPSAKASPWRAISAGFARFFHSFSAVMNETSDIKNSGGALTVWINKPAQYVEALRELTAQAFTEKTGIDVVYSIMPDEAKITLANSTGSNPDLALGLSYYRPAEFAMRGMAKNLLEYDDFLDWYGAEYNINSLAAMAYEDGVFGASETQDFYVLFYRKDILDMLGLKVPDTWDDVKQMMPTLHRSAMNFNHPIANSLSYKSFAATSPFIFQNGGDYYSADGLSSNFNDAATLKGLREMMDLYLVYGLAQNIPNFFNSFRTGAVPIGVSTFDTYLKLQVSAPELVGLWDIAPPPGTVQPDGSVSRWTSADMTSAMIFSNTDMSDEAYSFLRWWLSSGTQINYANSLQMKYGPDYVWNTANHAAFAQMTYPDAHKKIILEQWDWQKEVFRHPASYVLEREVSNAWIDIVTNGAAFRPRIDNASLSSNREMRRKLTEFGYIGKQGEKVKDYNVRLIDELILTQSLKE